MIKPIPPHNYLNGLKNLPVIDVRAPAEYANGHIPGAVNIPLFSDQERAIVGTIYKQEGRESAVRKGFELVAPHITQFIDTVQGCTRSRELVLYCARGGMRSKSIATVLDFSGYTVHLMTGGFKAFKNYLRACVTNFTGLVLIGGKTGSGKTAILAELEKLGEQVLDLEGLARHRGSALGALGQLPQLTQEQFILNCYSRLVLFDSKKPVWLEHEGCRLGELQVPHELYTRMSCAPVVHIELPVSYRAARLMGEYGNFPCEELRGAVVLMERRLGSEATKRVLELIDAGDRERVLAMLLDHYDRSYVHSMERNRSNKFYQVALDPTGPAEHAVSIREFLGSIPNIVKL